MLFSYSRSHELRERLRRTMCDSTNGPPILLPHQPRTIYPLPRPSPAAILPLLHTSEVHRLSHYASTTFKFKLNMLPSVDAATSVLLLSPTLPLVIGLVLALYVGIRVLTSTPRLPPGPRGFPLIGNALDFPKEDQGRKFHDLSKQYGELALYVLTSMISFDYPRRYRSPQDIWPTYYSSRNIPSCARPTGQTVCYLLRQTAIDHGQAVRSASFSLLYVFGIQLIASYVAPIIRTAFTEWATTLVEYGPRWRTHRRALHQELGAEFVSKYRTVQLQIAHELLRKLLQDPTHFLKHIET